MNRFTIFLSKETNNITASLVILSVFSECLQLVFYFTKQMWRAESVVSISQDQ